MVRSIEVQGYQRFETHGILISRTQQKRFHFDATLRHLLAAVEVVQL